jgi:effector-binding domain-containing protein
MRFWLEAGVPVDKEVKSSCRVSYKIMPGGNVVRADHYGSYESTGLTHDKMHEWMYKNGKTIKGSPWESYVTDPMAEKDTLKWLTQIYYPVE